MAITKNQLKRPYKIPRSLKKSIKKNLIKIVKARKAKLRAEEHKKTSIEIEARTFETTGYFSAFDHIIQTYEMSDELARALDDLLFRCICNTRAGIARQRAGLLGKKEFAEKVLEGGYLTEKIQKEMLVWKGEGEGEGEGEGGSGTTRDD